MGQFAKVSRKRKIETLSWGLATRMADLALISLFLGLTLSLPSKHTGKFLSKIFRKIHQSLDEEKIKAVFYRLKQQGLVSYSKRLWQTPQITQAGRKRLTRLLPEYNETRTWDKRLYLISYDIPEVKKPDRDNLRRVLKTLGCGLLQESVWLTPYNPKEVLESFVAKNNLIGQVLVSDLGTNGTVGEEDNRGLVSRVYHLDDLNRRYQEFINQWTPTKAPLEMLTHFFSILKDDPQLPFELLPDDWLGESAWELVKSMSLLSGSVAKT